MSICVYPYPNDILIPLENIVFTRRPPSLVLLPPPPHSLPVNAFQVVSPLGSSASITLVGLGNRSSSNTPRITTAIPGGRGGLLPATASLPPLPPVGAPLRPRYYVSRDRFSSAAAAALIRGGEGRQAGGAEGGRSGHGEGGDEENASAMNASAVVSFAGNPGTGKACLAADVVARKDVRAKFEERVLWLQVCGYERV